MIFSGFGTGTRGILGAVTLALLVGGCGGMSEFTDKINPWGKEKTLAGERRPVFQGADPALVTTQKAASIGGASGGQSWPTAGGGLTNNPGNVAVSVSGTKVWKARIGATGGSFGVAPLRVSARPVSDGSRIFVYKPNGDVVALSTAGGRLWTKSLRPEGEKDAAPGGGVAVSGGRVYVSTAYRQVAALDAGSGQVLWNVQLSTPARGAPAVGNGHVFVVTESNEVYALKQEDGSEAWTYAGIQEMGTILSAANPAIAGNLVVVPSSAGEVLGLNIKTGEAKWIDGVTRGFRTQAVSGLADVSASPVIAGDTVYATGVAGRTIATSLKTGARLWGQDLGSVHTPVVSGNALFMIDLDDRMVALDRKTGEPLWSTVLPRPAKKKKRRNWAGPVLANGALIAMSSDGRFAAVDAASGKIMLTKETGTDVYVTPIVAGGRMIALDGDDSVAAFN